MRLDEFTLWCEDDCPTHDLTTMGLGIEDVPTRVDVCVKANTCVAGVKMAHDLFTKMGARVTLYAKDGMDMDAGERIMTVLGSAGAIHRTYKVAQCVMEYASGIASYTQAMLDAARCVAPKISVSGTRKMMPGSRAVAYAGLLAGGGVVHRYGLSDSILVFDQHRVLCQDQADIDARLRTLIAAHPERKVAIEVDSLEEAIHYANVGVGIVQCEKFTPDALKDTVDAVRQISSHITLLAAGGVTKDNAAAYAATGVDVLVTSRMYFAPPKDIKMRFSRANGADGA